jgi:hypothetical protein
MADSDVRKKLENKVVWDAADGGNGPVVKDGVFYPSRRSFLATFGGIAAAVVGVMTGKGLAALRTNKLPGIDPETDRSAMGFQKHTDTHNDGQDYRGGHIDTHIDYTP